MTDFVILPDNPAPELAESVWVQGPEGRKVRLLFAPALSKFSKPRGTAIICPGRTEFIEKYFEVARDMQARGFAVVIFDWPGQGLSDRDLEDAKAGHVEDFDVFVAALGAGMTALGDKVVQPQIVLAHSMGGAIALEALRKQVIDVEAAAFSAPMWGIKMPPLAGMIASVQCALGQGQKLVSAHVKDEVFEENVVTHDKARWLMQQALLETKPDLALGSVTWRWVRSALDVVKRFTRPHALDHLDMPVMVASAAEEKLVDNNSHDQVASLLKNAEHITIKGAMHELLMESEPKREQFMTAFDRLLERANV